MRFYKKLSIPENKINETWEGMNKTAEDIKNAKINYDIFGESKNSNSTIRTICEENGIDIDECIPNEIKKEDVPGFENSLKNDIILSKDVSEWSKDDLNNIMYSDGYRFDKDVQKKVENYFNNKYPDKVKYDATGRMIDGEVKVKAHIRDGIDVRAYSRGLPY